MAWISFRALPCRKNNLMTARVSMLLKSRVSLTCFRACFLADRAKDLSVPLYYSLPLSIDRLHENRKSESRKLISTVTFHVYYPHCGVLWICENLLRNGRTFVVGVNEIVSTVWRSGRKWWFRQLCVLRHWVRHLQCLLFCLLQHLGCYLILITGTRLNFTDVLRISISTVSIVTPIATAHVRNSVNWYTWTGPEGSRRLRLPDFKTIGTWRW